MAAADSLPLNHPGATADNASDRRNAQIETLIAAEGGPLLTHNYTRKAQSPMDKALSAAEWVGDAVLNVPPKTRLWGAIAICLGWSAGVFSGHYIKTFKDAAAWPGKKVPQWLEPVRKFLDFSEHSTAFKDRGKKLIFSLLIPAVFGIVGTATAIQIVFRKSLKNRTPGAPEHYEDYEDVISNQRGQKLGFLASLSAAAASSGALWVFPFFPGYGGTITTATTLANNQRTSLPGFGKWFANSGSSAFTMGTRALQNFSTRYFARNLAVDPKRQNDIADAMIRPIFHMLSPGELDKLTTLWLDEVHAIRDPFLIQIQNGADQKSTQKALEEKLKQSLSGAGFEAMLDRALAKLGYPEGMATPKIACKLFYNGAAGKVGDMMGAGSVAHAQTNAYLEKYKARRAKREASILAEGGQEPAPAMEKTTEKGRESPATPTTQWTDSVKSASTAKDIAETRAPKGNSKVEHIHHRRQHAEQTGAVQGV